MPPVRFAIGIAAALVLAVAACGGEKERGGGLPSFAQELHGPPASCGLRADGDREDETRAAGRAEQVRAVAAAVERIRGLRFRRELEPTFLPAGELASELERIVRGSLTTAEAESGERALRVLGAVPDDFDLREVLVESVGGGAAGAYEPETGRILVAEGGDRELDGLELETLAHELEHALSDQVFGLPEGRPADRWGDTDLAAAALVEGSATITGWRYAVATAGDEGLRRARSEAAGLRLAAPLLGLPHVLAQVFVFPYVEGIGFVCTLYRQGGWKAVDAAFERPPASTAEILFPQRYLDGERPEEPPGLGAPEGWRKDGRASGVFGAADLLWLFQAPGRDTRLGLDEPLERAGAWAGGRLELWTRGDASAVGIALVERASSERSLCGSLEDWYRAAFPAAEAEGQRLFVAPGRVAVLACDGRNLRLGIAPDETTARALVGR
jgi:hypothetical protein